MSRGVKGAAARSHCPFLVLTPGIPAQFLEAHPARRSYWLPCRRSWVRIPSAALPDHALHWRSGQSCAHRPAGGSPALAAGMVLLVVTTVAESSVTCLAGAVIGCPGCGVAFLGARGPDRGHPTEHCAAMLSAFHVVAYVAPSLPAIAGGLVVSARGLLRTFEFFGTSLGARPVRAFLAWRRRPRTHQAHHHASPGAGLLRPRDLESQQRRSRCVVGWRGSASRC